MSKQVWLDAEAARRARRTGRIYVALAAVLWSSSGLFAKAPLFQGWESEVRGPLLAFWRALFAGLLLAPLVRAPRFSWRFVPLVVCFPVMNVTYLTAMTVGAAANAIWLQNTAPGWVFLGTVFFARQAIHRADALMLVFAAAGVGFILSFELQGQDQLGIFCGLASGAAYAGVVMAMRALRGEEPAWLVVVAHLATAAILFPYVFFLGAWPDWRQTAVLAAFGFFQMALPYWCFARGLRTIASPEAAVITLLEPLLLPVWVFFAWGEEPAWWTLAGGGLIFSGLLLRYAGPAWAVAAGREGDAESRRVNDQ